MASSHINTGSIGNAEGIPVNTLDKTGVIIPQRSPYNGPHVKPQTSTGKCMGKRNTPLRPKACPRRYGNQHTQCY